ncbi:transporter substrate-binding domain-containing protein [Xanthobacter sediminis]|uniref:transporter substrate-binding domain-containing protein n=1 Tax=Xanthobacter sediminis TaxID=3119926 RepID=UPI00372C2588
MPFSRKHLVRLTAAFSLIAALGCAALLLLAPEQPRAAGRDFAGQPLRVGVPWLPPPDAPDSRLYLEEGFELDFAGEIAAALGAELRLARVQPEDADRALSAGEVDLVVSRAGTGDPMRGKARIITTGFTSGLSLAMRSDRPLDSWSALAGRTVCAVEANARARALVERLGATVKVLRAPAPALILMRTGDCDAAILDQTLLDPLLKMRSWQKFSATLPPQEPTTLVVAVPPGDAGLAQAVAAALSPLDTRERWRGREERWAATVSFEVYRDQVAADCH